MMNQSLPLFMCHAILKGQEGESQSQEQKKAEGKSERAPQTKPKPSAKRKRQPSSDDDQDGDGGDNDEDDDGDEGPGRGKYNDKAAGPTEHQVALNSGEEQVDHQDVSGLGEDVVMEETSHVEPALQEVLASLSSIL